RARALPARRMGRTSTGIRNLRDRLDDEPDLHSARRAARVLVPARQVEGEEATGLAAAVPVSGRAGNDDDRLVERERLGEMEKGAPGVSGSVPSCRLGDLDRRPVERERLHGPAVL